MKKLSQWRVSWGPSGQSQERAGKRSVWSGQKPMIIRALQRQNELFCSGHCFQYRALDEKIDASSSFFLPTEAVNHRYPIIRVDKMILLNIGSRNFLFFSFSFAYARTSFTSAFLFERLAPVLWESKKPRDFSSAFLWWAVFWRGSS